MQHRHPEVVQRDAVGMVLRTVIAIHPSRILAFIVTSATSRSTHDESTFNFTKALIVSLWLRFSRRLVAGGSWRPSYPASWLAQATAKT